ISTVPMLGGKWSENAAQYVASIQEVHVFSPRVLNTLRVGYSRAAFNYDSFRWRLFRRIHRWWRVGTWRDRHLRRAYNNGPLRHHGGRPKQCFEGLEPQKLIYRIR